MLFAYQTQRHIFVNYGFGWLNALVTLAKFLHQVGLFAAGDQSLTEATLDVVEVTRIENGTFLSWDRGLLLWAFVNWFLKADVNQRGFLIFFLDKRNLLYILHANSLSRMDFGILSLRVRNALVRYFEMIESNLIHFVVKLTNWVDKLRF